MKPAVAAFTLDQEVFHKIRPEVAGMVTGILRRHNGYSYFVTWTGDDLEETEHQENEITTEKNYANS